MSGDGGSVHGIAAHAGSPVHQSANHLAAGAEWQTGEEVKHDTGMKPGAPQLSGQITFAF
jgi:hypothetical protein